MFEEEYAALGDRKAHINTRASLGLELVNSVRHSESSRRQSTNQALLIEARDLLEPSVQMAEEFGEPGDSNISASLSCLASLHAYRKDFNEAETAYETAIRVHLTRTSNEADKGLIVCRNNLACLWANMNKFRDAENLHARLLDICIEHYELWHPMTLNSMSNLFHLFHKTGQSEEARMLIQDYISRFHVSLEETLRKDERGTFDIEHAKYHVGRALANCDYYEEATLLLEMVATIWREQHKRDDEMLILLTALRYCYLAQKPPQLQREYQTSTKLIELRGDLSGPQHVETLKAIEVQVECLRRMNRMEEALEMLIEARKAGQGTSHEDTLNNISYLAEIFEDMEDWQAALKARQEVYESRKGKDPDSLETIAQASRIAVLSQRLVDWEHVVKMRKNEVEAWRKIEGPDSTTALKVLVAVGEGLAKLGNHAEAKDVLDEAIEGLIRLLGPSHFDTLATFRVKAIICRGSNELDESERILNRVLQTRAEFPMEDSICCSALASLSKVYSARGQLDRAIDLHREAVDACKKPQGDEGVVHPEDLILPDLAREYAAALRWDEAEWALDQALGKLRSRQETRATSRMIRECEALLEEFKGRKRAADEG